MSTLLSDLRYAVRLWLRHPSFTAVVVLTLALGIGANGTIFSVVRATLLQPLAFPEPDRLVSIWKGQRAEPRQFNIVSHPDYERWRARSQSFESVGALDSAGRGYNLTGEGEPEQVSGVRVSASFFEVLGVPPMLGRTFREEEETLGRDDVAVLSHSLWTRRYGADPSLVGRVIRIDGRPHTVIGIMPRHFRFQFLSGLRELWVPAGWRDGDRANTSNSFMAIGRLRAGVSLEEARLELDAIGPAGAANGEPYAGWTARIAPMSEVGMDAVAQPVIAMLCAVGFVLLIACVNVANMMLARSAARQRELAIRASLGAGRGRLARQLVTESLLLAMAGGTAGLLLATWTTSLLEPLLPGSFRLMPLRPFDGIAVDWPVLAFTGGISVVSGVLFGLAPAAVVFRGSLSDPMKAQVRGTTSAKSRLRYGLVTVEVALTLVALAGAGVMIASVARLLGVDPGLDPANILVANMALPQEDLFNGPPGNPRFCQQLDEHIGTLPGVVSVSAVAHLPLTGASAGRGLLLEGQPDPGPNARPGSLYSVACPNVLRTFGIRLVAGREFTHRDVAGAPDVALVSESLAERLWPDEDAVGKRFKLGNLTDAPWITVVGVMGNIRKLGLDNNEASWLLRPYGQAGWPMLSIVTKTTSSPRAFESQARGALRIIEPERPVANVFTMDDARDRSVEARRFTMVLLSTFASLALVLAAVGISGVVGYSVVQRTPEIGVRMALGARPSQVLRLIVGHSMRWVFAGAVLGLAAALGVLKVLQSQLGTILYEVSPTDPFVFSAVSAVLMVVALTASYLPARRAASVDPVAALRFD